MMHVFPARLVGASFLPPVERTVFHADGSRSVVGDLGVCHYAVDGTVTFAGRVPERDGDHTRWDLAA